MIKTQAQTLIRCPLEPVFGFVAEDFVHNYPRWSSEVKAVHALSEGPIRVGWEGRQVRVDRGHRSESRFRVTALEPGRWLSFHGISDPYRIDYRFESLGARTRVAFSFELERLNFALRPFEGLIRLVVQESGERMMVNLKGLVERELARHANP